MISRRRFIATGTAGIFSMAGAQGALGLGHEVDAPVTVDVAAIDRARILRAANSYLREAPVTITTFHAARSTGGMHDYFLRRRLLVA